MEAMPHRHEHAATFSGALLSERYGHRGKGAVSVRAPRIADADKAPYSSLVHKGSPGSGGYGGTSFMLFPSDQGSMFSLVVGTQGLAPDEDILTWPRHARRGRAFSRWFDAQQIDGAQAWSKSDPTRIDVALPDNVKLWLGAWPAATRIYGALTYVAVSANSATPEQIEAAFLAPLDGIMAEDGKFASSEESVGKFRLREPAKHVIQREFGDPERPIAVRFSQCDFGFVVQPLDDAAGELLLGPEVVEQKFPVRAHRAGELLHRIDARAHRSLAPGIEELGGPGR